MSMIYRHLLRLILATVVGVLPLTLLPTASAQAEAPAVNVFEILRKQGITTLKSGQLYHSSRIIASSSNGARWAGTQPGSRSS